MKKSTIVIIVVLVFVLGGTFFALAGSDESNNTNADKATSQSIQEASESSDANAEETFTTAEVALHNKPTDCWTIVDGSVYEITEYIPRHPGGDEILKACGDDGTSLFKERTTGQGEIVGSGTPHSSNAEAQLSGFKIGNLPQ